MTLFKPATHRLNTPPEHTPLTLRINAPPCPKARARVFGGHAVTPKATRDWEQLVERHAWLRMRELGLVVFEGAVGVEVTFGLAAWKGDLDNYVKGVCDALNGVVYKDDRQVVQLTACKLKRPDAPFVRITVTPLPKDWDGLQEK